MVDSIKNMISRQDLHVKKDKAVASSSDSVNSSTAQKIASVDTVEVGAKANNAAVLDMAKAPNIDNAAVSRIKEAIAQGEYPVDLDRVTDALMEAYLELKS